MDKLKGLILTDSGYREASDEYIDCLKNIEIERIKFQVYEGIRDLGYNVSYEELFVLLETFIKDREIEEKSNVRTT